MDTLTPTTLLEAVNSMLATIGEAPVNTLTNVGLGDVATALDELKLLSRRTQARGWHWNSDEALTIIPNQDGELVLPANTLQVDTTGKDADKDLVQRGQRLYDRKNHTYTFDESVLVDIVSFLDFEELPEVARQFIFISAARSFQQKTVGSDTLNGFTEQDEIRALAALVADDMETGDYNMLTGNWSVARVLQRT